MHPKAFPRISIYLVKSLRKLILKHLDEQQPTKSFGRKRRCCIGPPLMFEPDAMVDTLSDLYFVTLGVQAVLQFLKSDQHFSCSSHFLMW